MKDDCPCSNYESIFCERCGEKIDGINRKIGQEFHGMSECLFNCSECMALCQICQKKECNCLEEMKKEINEVPILDAYNNDKYYDDIFESGEIDWSKKDSIDF